MARTLARRESECCGGLSDSGCVWVDHGLAQRFVEDGSLLHWRPDGQPYYSDGRGGYPAARDAVPGPVGRTTSPIDIPTRLRESLPARQSGAIGPGGPGHRRYVHADHLPDAEDDSARSEDGGSGPFRKSVPAGCADLSAGGLIEAG